MIDLEKNIQTNEPPNFGLTFMKDFDAPAALRAAGPASYAALELDGVQTNANITLNGVPLLATNNMFRQWRAELPAGLLGKQNRLSIAIASTPSPVNCSNPTTHNAAGHAPCTDVSDRDTRYSSPWAPAERSGSRLRGVSAERSGGRLRALTRASEKFCNANERSPDGFRMLSSDTVVATHVGTSAAM